MRNILDRLIWVVLFVFFVPTSLVIASWSSLPGDLMFPIKLGLERSLLAIVSPSYEVSGQLQIKYTERRFADAQKLLAVKNSVNGLPYLDQQVETAKMAIEKAPNPQARQALASQYIATLTTVSSALEQQKLELTQTPAPSGNSNGTAGQAPASTTPRLAPASPGSENQPTIFVASPTLTPTPTPVINSAISYPNVSPTPTPAPTLTTVVSTVGTTPPPQNLVVAMQITQTQQQINKTIDDLKKENPSENPSGNENKKQDNEQKNQDKNKPDQSTQKQDQGKDR